LLALAAAGARRDPPTIRNRDTTGTISRSARLLRSLAELATEEVSPNIDKRNTNPKHGDLFQEDPSDQR
jgi:hypothetical protein